MTRSKRWEVVVLCCAVFASSALRSASASEPAVAVASEQHALVANNNSRAADDFALDGAFYCAEDYDSCWRWGSGRVAITPGIHVPNTSSGLGYSIYLDGHVRDYSARFIPGGIEWSIDGYDLGWAPCGAIQYLWVGPPLSNQSACFGAGSSLQSVKGYPIGDFGPFTFEILADSVPFDINFTVDPALLKKIHGDGMTVPVGTSTGQRIVVEVDNPDNTPVNFSKLPKFVPVTATLTAPKSTPTQIPDGAITYLGNAQFAIQASVGSATGSYLVTVRHQDADPNSPAIFTLNVVAKVPPPDNADQEQGNGANSANADQMTQTNQANLFSKNSPAPGGSPCPDPSIVGDPINVTNGSTLHMEVDYAQTGLSTIEFTRSYNSLGSKSSLMNNYWTTTYDRMVVPASGPSPLRLRRPDGQTIRFNLVGGAYVADLFFHGTLTKNGSGWSYTDTVGTVETYNSGGRLTSVADLRGRTQTLSYASKTGLLSSVKSNTGETLTFAYNSNGQVSTVTDQASRVWTYAYDGYMNLTSVKYPNGTYHQYFYTDTFNPYLLTGMYVGPTNTAGVGQSEVRWEYDSAGLATATYFPDAHQPTGQLRRTDIHYDPDGATRGVMDGNANIGVYNTNSVHGKGFVNAIAGPGATTCGNDLEIGYDASMNVKSTSRSGSVTNFIGYDDKGQHARRVDAVGTTEERQTDFAYDSRFFNKPTTVTEPSVVAGYSKTTNLTYDPYGNLKQRTESGYRPNANPALPPTAISRTWAYTYSGPYHQLSQITGPRTDVSQLTNFGYSTGSGRLVSVTDPNGIDVRTNITYTATGNVQSEDRPNGLHIVYAYYVGSDLLQSVTQTQGSLRHVTSWTYDSDNRVSGITFSNAVDPDQSLSFAYNNAGKLSRVGDGSGENIIYSFDAQGNVTGTSYSNGNSVQYSITKTFDAYNRINKVIGANNTIEYNYYPDGTLTQTEDGKQQQTLRRYDGLKRLTTVIRPDSSQIQYGYDAAGNLDLVIDPNSATTTYVYDDFGNKITQISPDTGTTQYVYDLAGNLIQTTDALGQVTKYKYDAGNRLLTVDRVGTAYDETYTYDTCENGVGFLCSITTGVGDAVAYAYNGFGQIANVTTLGNSVVAYQYDALNHITQMTYPSGRTVSYSYNGGGQVTKVAVNENGNVTNLASNVVHKPFGPVASWTYGNGLTHTRQYDTQYWTRAISTPGASTLAYPQYDSNGNLLTMQVDTASDQFTYDTFDELKTASGDFGSRSYDYDAVGNRISLTANGANSTYAYTPQSNRITGQTGWTYTLDANGNTRQKLATDGSGGGLSYTFSPHNRLTGVYDNLAPTVPKATYRYNALGQRVAKIAGATETHYVYSLDGKLLAETDIAGHVLQEYVYLDGAPLALLDAPIPRPPVGSYDVIVEASQFFGSWTIKSDTTAVGGSYNYLSKPSATSYANWTFTTPGAGYYDVYVSWEGGGGTVTKYEVNSTPVTLTNAAQTKGAWSKLGNFHLAGGTNSIRILGSDNAEKNDYITADAARMVQTLSDAPPNPNYKYVHTDQLGAPRAVTNANGALIWKATYDPFGLAKINDDIPDVGRHTTVNLRFPGQYYDQESGLHYNYFRDYDPTIGRYLESDPIGLRGGLNAFGYVGADPISGVDVLGLAVGEPGVAESFVPIWGSGREAINDFQEGNYGWGTANAALAISDVVLVSTAGKAICKGIWKGGSNAWRATRNWYGATRDLASGTPVHHWLIERNSDFGKLVPDWLKNQPWNLLPMESREFHNAVHGWGPNAFNAVEAAWYGTPNWAMLLWSDEMGKSANAAANH